MAAVKFKKALRGRFRSFLPQRQAKIYQRIADNLLRGGFLDKDQVWWPVPADQPPPLLS